MTAGRDFAGFAIPFAAGTLAASFLWTEFHPASSALIAMTSATLLAAGIPAAMLMHPSHIQAEDRSVMAAVILLSLATGMFCYLSAALRDISSIPSSGWLIGVTETAGAAMREAADAIPFTDGRSNAIVKALLTGDRSSLPREVTEAFRDSGASHILALSGLHLGIIYGIVTKTLSFIGKSPAAIRMRSAGTVLICGFYTLATGAGASIVRAFIFILSGETARLTGRQKSLNIILPAAIVIQLTVSPLSIRDIGFQLSYAAMAGIAYIYPHLKRMWPEEEGEETSIKAMTIRPLKKIWDSAALSLSCQLTTGPLAWLYFRTFPQHFLLTNLIALPLTGVIIPAALLTTGLHAAGICPGILLHATEILITALIRALEIIATM